MIINNAPVNEAIVSNVAEIGEFRIRNSAKAFNILSSGLYANKILAIIRELSCNAVDSHVAAGKKDVPFDVHLPSTLEPWFSIRDHGTGLTHEQVTQIYTTYFESTKTASNEFIGALGLGSKSPFSYTDNFTVTAIKDGKKGIYSAFINEQGVPSIALMMSEDTDEPAGVEVKFSVNDRWDFDKFRQEAKTAYTFFELRPVVTGGDYHFTFNDVQYETKDIIPGVHSTSGSRHESRAVMGNIAYPIHIPQAEVTPENAALYGLLSCGLVMHFNIGELDFQASREGLSYIPQTIEAIRKKLEVLVEALSGVLAKEADAIPNLWDRAVFLAKKREHRLWNAAVTKYAADTNLATYDSSSYGRTTTFKLDVKQLAKKFNIEVRGFHHTRGSRSSSNLKASNDYSDKRDANGRYIYTTSWHFLVDSSSQFIINDTKVGAVERAKFHFRNTEDKDNWSRNVFVLDAVDRTQPMKTKAFFKAICNPPESRIANASTLKIKPRAESGLGKNVTIMRLEERGYGGYYRQREMVWKDAGKADQFDSTTTFYYLPLSGFTVQSKSADQFDAKQFVMDLKDCGLPQVNKTVYGVRKGDIEFIKKQKNWVNLEEFITQELSKPIDNKLVMSLVLQAIDSQANVMYNHYVLGLIENSNSPYSVFVSKLKGYEKIKYSDVSLKRLCHQYAKGTTFSPEAQVQVYVEECAKVINRYPLLNYLRSVPHHELAEYINMIDTQKGVN